MKAHSGRVWAKNKRIKEKGKVNYKILTMRGEEMKKVSSKDFVGINLKARLKNKLFVSGLISVLALIASKVALDFFGVDISSTVESVIDITEYVLYLLVMLGVLVDPTVEGFGDSDYTKTKDEPSKKGEILGGDK